ncbi:GFA family protein [Massilia consociata]|uniref:GFA family protein n=1 Tax=Massilia consociata TaxID=760117 RepID=A0ABV6FBC3_9BURK
MNIPFSGGCACGAIRYTAAREPIAMLNCHCRDCQLSSGAPFASGIVVMTADLEVSGAPKTHAVRAGSGALAIRSFCPDCGTPLFTQGEANPQFTSIRFPTLDVTSGFKPMLDIHTASAQPWVCLDQAIPHFPQSPQPA